ncbi:MAG: GatB/YqeY domain-containing protein [Pseudomonadota bacterium]
MPESAIRNRITEATTSAMRARARDRLAVLRLLNAELKRVEVDERRELDDQDVLVVLNRMLKQRQDALAQYEAAARGDLAEAERFEIEVLEEFMPEPLDEAELDGLIAGAIKAVGAASPRDMGKVMGILKPKVQGRADMSVVSAKVKSKLG